MSREWRLFAPNAGPGVPPESVGDVRVVTMDAAWVWMETGPVLLSSVTALSGPITAGIAPPEEFEAGHHVFLTRGRAVPVDGPQGSVGGAGRDDLDPVRLESEWLSDRAAALGPDSAVGIAKEIAGWGPGLTPSGDDVLIGYLLARQRLQRDGWAAEAQDIVEILDTRTGELSQRMAHWATRGQAFAVVVAALTALLGDAQVDAPAVAALDSLGHESGRATLAGMVAGLRAR